MAPLPTARVVSRQARLAHAQVAVHEKNQYLAMLSCYSPTCKAMQITAC